MPTFATATSAVFDLRPGAEIWQDAKVADIIAIHETRDAEEFLSVAGGWLSRDPVGSNVAATVALGRADNIHESPGDRFWYATKGPDVVGACLRTPPRGALLPRLTTPVAEAFSTYLAERHRRIPGINGPLQTGKTFLGRWRSITGESAKPTLRTSLFRLGRLNPPTDVAGRLRQATVADEDQVVAWTFAFSEEALPAERIGLAELAAAYRRKLAVGAPCWIWEVDGRPVSMLHESSPVSGVVRIQAVYTPPEERRKGYAGACVSAVAAAVLNRDGLSECILFADQANQTSTGLYRRLGFEEDFESVKFDFVRT